MPESKRKPIREALGESDAFLSMQAQLSLVAPVERPVLILGERGTGKELAATRLHYLSQRWQHKFATLNCAVLSPTLLESELFGHEAGSFTGATRERKGRFEMAHEGTLFLDEIGNMPMSVQEKILRLIEYGRFERVGSSRQISVDVRIIAATNADITGLADAGAFKPDLLDRLSFEVVHLPPLRERGEDIMLLANHFAMQMAVELGLKEIPGFSPSVTRRLHSYTWPGNVRELKNVIERAVYQSAGKLIQHITINPFYAPSAKRPELEHDSTPAQSAGIKMTGNHGSLNLKKAAENLKLSFIQESLIRSRFNQKKAAALLGLSYHQFRGLYRKYAQLLKQQQPGG